jgi:ubiquinone biosynthesis protein UbiJ
VSSWQQREPAQGDPLALLAALLNRVTALDPEHQQILQPLQGRRLRLRVDEPASLSLDLCVDAGRLLLIRPGDGEADVELRGSAWGLLKLLRSNGQAFPGGVGVSVRGDLAVLEAVRTVIGRLRPDWQEPIARLIGDRAAAPVTRAAAALFGAALRGAREARDLGVEYLREESGQLIRADDVDAFARAVQRLSDDTERVLKRFEALDAAIALRRQRG